MGKKLALVTALLFLTACSPYIYSLDPNTGPEHTLVEVDGKNMFFTSVLWDAETASQTVVPGGFLGGYMFTVPPGASQGNHDVQLKNSYGISNKKPFTVTVPSPFGAPRLDRISLLFASFSGGNVNTWLYVQGANCDVGAEVLINGTVQPTVAHKAIQDDLLGISPNDLAYPIYHHLAFIVWPGEHKENSAITVQIRNSDGQTSSIENYTLPADAATMDSDGDDIPDEWEKNGYDADGDGVIDVDLPALGADPLRPDLFIEVDVMLNLTNTPGAVVWQAAESMFENAPIINPIADNGINLHLDTSGTVPHHSLVSFTETDDATIGRANFYTLKSNNFDNDDRGRIYHYSIWAEAQPGGASGISDVKLNAAWTDFSGPGDDFIVSFDNFPLAYLTDRSMVETLVHELGHNLLQKHGGYDHFAYNPTYNSVMSYSWQLRTGHDNARRRNHPIYFPFYYGQNGAVEVNGALPAIVGVIVDYSSGMGRNLVESSLDETVGLFNNIGIDWNNDGDTVDVNVSEDLNNDGDTNDTLKDFPNWFKLTFSGPRENGQYGN
jgi:hypothetical protein